MRRPRGIQKRILFSLASQEVPKWILEAIWTPWGWSLNNFWSNFSFKIWSEVFLSLQFCIAFRRVPNAWNFYIGILRDIFLAGLGILDQRVDYFLFALQVRALSVTVNNFYM